MSSRPPSMGGSKVSAGVLDRTAEQAAASPAKPNRFGPIVTALGSLLFVVGVVVHFYAVPALAKFPNDINQTTRLSATGATVFDISTLKPITTDLSVLNRTVGVPASKVSRAAGSVVWASMTTITSVPDQVVRSQNTVQIALDNKTAQAVPNASDFSETTKGVRTPTHPTGNVFTYPMFTKKQQYQVWDNTLNGAVTASYQGTTSIQGMRVYKFAYQVPASVIGSMSLPASIFGLPGHGNVQAQSYYQNSVTQYVEPTTGAIINSVQDVKQWFQAQGHSVTTTAAHLAYTPQTVSQFIHDYQGDATRLALASGPLPWLVMALGLVLMVGGLGASRRHHL